MPDDLNSWYYVVRGIKNGPANGLELDRLLAERIIRPDTYVWRKGISDWKAAVETDLALRLVEVPPPVPAFLLDPKLEDVPPPIPGARFLQHPTTGEFAPPVDALLGHYENAVPNAPARRALDSPPPVPWPSAVKATTPSRWWFERHIYSWKWQAWIASGLALLILFANQNSPQKGLLPLFGLVLTTWAFISFIKLAGTNRARRAALQGLTIYLLLYPFLLIGVLFLLGALGGFLTTSGNGEKIGYAAGTFGGFGFMAYGFSMWVPFYFASRCKLPTRQIG